MCSYFYMLNIEESFESHKSAANEEWYKTSLIDEIEDHNFGVRRMYIRFSDCLEGVHFAIKYSTDLSGYVSGGCGNYK